MICLLYMLLKHKTYVTTESQMKKWKSREHLNIEGSMLVFSKAKITHYHPLLSQQNFTFCGKLGLFLPQHSDRCFRDGMLEPVLKLQTKYPFYYRKPETQHSWFWSEGVKFTHKGEDWQRSAIVWYCRTQGH